MLEKLLNKLALFSIRYLFAVDNFLLGNTMEEMYVVCKKTKEFFALDTVEVVEYVDKGHGTAAKFLCPLCDEMHTSMIMEHKA